MNNNVMRSDLGKVQGLGSAKHGVGHWKIQRIKIGRASCRERV